jgi:rhodanese-related sulfurtransferase
MAINTITIADIRRLIESGKTLNLIDVRTPGEFARRHARGAKLIPLDSLDVRSVAAARLDPQEAIYVICQSGGRSTKAAQQFVDAGIAPVYSMDGGTSAWEKLGLPVERGKTGPISLERQVRIAAGSLVVLSLLLARFVHPWFLALAAFVGLGLIFAGITDFCGMGMLLAKMPWNQA